MKFLAIPGLMRYFLRKEAETPYMLKWAIYPFAFMIFLSGCQPKMIYPPPSEQASPFIPPIVLEESVPLPDLAVSDITLNETGRVVIRLSNAGKKPENNALRKRLEGSPLGPDIVVKELDLTDDFELSIVLSNAGELELRKGTTLRIRILLNDRRVSEFDHFISEPLKPSFGTRYIIDPPYRVRINENARVKVVIWPKQSTEDIHLENNTLERNFAIYPFKISPQASQEFPLLLFSLRPKDNRQGDKVKTEVRWDGGGSPLKLSLRGTGHYKRIAPITGKSPLKLEVPIKNEKNLKKRPWRISVANLMEKAVEGHLIIQYP